MPTGRKKKSAGVGSASQSGKAAKASKTAKAQKPSKVARRGPKVISKEERRRHKLEARKREKYGISADMWALPPPSHLIAKLEAPKPTSKYHSYYEFADNTERKKKLEFSVTNDPNPPPGFKFVPFGDPVLTNECKELSREYGAMILVVSASKEENSKISEHVYRTGYHFRETIVDEARGKVGEREIPTIDSIRNIEKIPESQADINKQADGAIRDLFPRIPNTDRQMIIEHAFKKGAQFHGEPTVGLQADLPLSRRVQLAVLAHIRHTHTRYDQLLRETSWMNARKVVEPVCLDFIVKWRADEETGRDQMDEILREVVIITDSEGSNDSSSDDTSSDDEDVISLSSGTTSQPISQDQMRSQQSSAPTAYSQFDAHGVGKRNVGAPLPDSQTKQSRTQRGFKRYQAAWEDAVSRNDGDLARPKDSLKVNLENWPSTGVELVSPYASQTLPFTGPTSESHELRRHENPVIKQSEPYYSQPKTPARFPESRNGRRGGIHTEDPIHYDDVTRRSRHSHILQPSTRDSSRRGLQDMLVPSIETAPSDVVDEARDRAIRGEPRIVSDQESAVPKADGNTRVAPKPREVIVISDSPYNEHHRWVVGDESAHSIPGPNSEPRFRSVAHRYSSHYHSEFSEQSRQSDSVPLSGNVQSSFRPQASIVLDRDPRLPVYDAPSEYGSIPDSSQFRRAGLGVDATRSVEPLQIPRSRLVLSQPQGNDQYAFPTSNGRVIERRFVAPNSLPDHWYRESRDHSSPTLQTLSRPGPSGAQSTLLSRSSQAEHDRYGGSSLGLATTQSYNSARPVIQYMERPFHCSSYGEEQRLARDGYPRHPMEERDLPRLHPTNGAARGRGLI